MKLRCKLFGHKWKYFNNEYVICSHCGEKKTIQKLLEDFEKMMKKRYKGLDDTYK